MHRPFWKAMTVYERERSFGSLIAVITEYVNNSNGLSMTIALFLCGLVNLSYFPKAILLYHMFYSSLILYAIGQIFDRCILISPKSLK